MSLGECYQKVTLRTRFLLIRLFSLHFLLTLILLYIGLIAFSVFPSPLTNWAFVESIYTT